MSVQPTPQHHPKESPGSITVRLRYRAWQDGARLRGDGAISRFECRWTGSA
jgi:hypothetical protein